MELLKQQRKIQLFVISLLILALTVFLVNYWQNYSHSNPAPSTTISPNPLITPSTSSPTITSTPFSLIPSTPTPSPIFTPTLTDTPASSPTSSASFSPTPFQTTSPIQSIPFFPSPTPKALYPGEVREYNGETLFSISDFYENSILGTQNLNNSTYSLTIKDLNNNSIQLTYEDLITKNQLYTKVVTIYCVEGWQATILWEGILIEDLLNQIDPATKAMTVIFHAADGYTTALPKEYLLNNNIIMAYKMNNLVLPPERGFPFQLVAESKYGYKWIKWITEIELSNSTDYLGYWESRGYPNNAEIP